ncbi:protein related to regulatory domain of methyltransferases [Beggiatoa alba B18LD]|uniref:Protein related to regulatory domain of methyltransferases n=1 Tax=Beggiatoa alba B18LD TaxID=395493 RepID=I3CCG4_9GAMM|nr:methyltransferase regulatory domain-containing protein [Beggiatoa alba]EIJ41307.1 protein related to regulatory domain of methyltransferases [Beggiatoa alba B18LD]
MSVESINSYDELPYLFNAMPYTQPHRIAAIAQLFGMNPPAPETARILELGCASGGNILATAYTFPKSRCVGVELSARQVAVAQQAIKELDLKNLVINQINIMDFDANAGQFDYIIAHGVYSWVSPTVREKILQICQQHLSPMGVAYISYNTKPGWNMRGTIRDMMLYHTQNIKDPLERVAQMRALWKFLADATQTGQDSYSLFLNEEFKFFANSEESYLFHDFLEEENNPIYFHEFVTQAAAYQLNYLGDAHLHTMLASNFPPEIAQTLELFKDDLVHQEQYMDFLRNRHFRHSLLCHQQVPLKRAISAERVTNLSVVSSLAEVQSTEIPQGKKCFINQSGNLVTDSPIVIAALTYLLEQLPRAVPFVELVEQTQTRLPANITADKEAIFNHIADIILQAYTKGLIELQVGALPFVLQAGNKPTVSALARWRVAHGLKLNNLRFENLNLEHPVVGALLPYLDGTRDRNALVTILEGKIADKSLQLNVKQAGQEIQIAPEQLKELLMQALEESLKALAKSALLIA